MQILNVAEITDYIKELLQSDRLLSDVWVRGEISNFSRSAAGHLYFSLKSEKSQIRCVLFRGNAQGLTFSPVNGDAVIAHGNVSLYEASGQYQLYVDTVHPEGTGLLQLQFEELRQRLEQEGLFDPSRKRILPAFPRYVGVVTSATGAVWHDIQTVLRRRYPLCELLLSPALVQGSEAPASIVEAIRRIVDDGRADLIIVGRGGGSMEDLWCFNDERVARAVFASPVPVVSAVGHETDYTICDFVADVRAATPSAAAEIIAPHIRDLEIIVDDLHDRMQRLVAHTVEERRRQLNETANRLDRQSPEAVVQRSRLRLDAIAESIEIRLLNRIEGERALLQLRARQLALIHPQQTMERGYAIVLDATSGARIVSAKNLAPDQEVILQFHDGHVSARIDGPQIAERTNHS